MNVEDKLISPEGKKEIQLMAEIENLFRQIEATKLDEETRKDIENELRDKIEQYRRYWRGEEKVEEEIGGYYERLGKIKKAA